MSNAVASTSRLLIQRATREDMPKVAQLIGSSSEWYRDFVHEEDMSEHQPDEAWQERNFAIREFYLGYADGEPVGTISIQYVGEYAYLGYIYLDVSQVGRGFGKQLMNFAASRVRAKGLKGLCLIAHPEAKWATKAYRKFGFTRIARDRDAVLRWNGGFLRDFYEEGFELYVLNFAPERAPSTRLRGVARV